MNESVKITYSSEESETNHWKYRPIFETPIYRVRFLLFLTVIFKMVSKMNAKNKIDNMEYFLVEYSETIACPRLRLFIRFITLLIFL